MEGYVLKYLYDRSNNPKEKRFLDYFKMQLDYRLYNYGMHQSSDFESLQRKHIEEIEQDKGLKKLLHPRRIWRKFKESLAASKKTIQTVTIGNLTSNKARYKVLSFVPLNKNAVEELKRNGIAVFHYGKPCFEGEVQLDSKSLRAFDKFREELEYADFNQMLTDENYDALEATFRDAVEEFRASEIDAVLVWTSETVGCKFIIDVFKEIGRPSITLQHGLPGIYSKTTEGRADYLCVWGKAIRDKYLKIGFDPTKVLVSGNAKYSSMPSAEMLRCDLQDVLVLTSATSGDHQYEWQWELFPKYDRELLITYLYSLETVLKKNGVQHARLRPHPSVSKNWLVKYIDMSFYEMDREDFKTSLTKATLCVGQLSSTVLEAMQYGVSYIVYEPSEDGVHGLIGGVIVPPFDGSSKYLKVANTEEQLNKMIKEKYVPDMRLLDEYMVPFDGAVIRNEIKDWKSKIKK